MSRFRGIASAVLVLAVAAEGGGCSSSTPATPKPPAQADFAAQLGPREGSYQLFGIDYRMDLAPTYVAFFFLGAGDIVDIAKSSLTDGSFVVPDQLGGTFRFPIRRNGEFEGTWVHEDTGHEQTSGKLVADTFAPDVKVDDLPTFPWDRVLVSPSEPVDLTAWENAFRVRSSDGNVPISLVHTESVGGKISPEIAFSSFVRFDDWHSVSGKTASLDIGPLSDRAGNTSMATSTPLAFVNLPAAPAVDFTAGAASVVATPAGSPYLTFRSADPICETGSCVEIGPYDVDPCAEPDTTVSAWVSRATDVTNLHVRYRILTNGAAGDTSLESLTGPFHLLLPVEKADTTYPAFEKGTVTLSTTSDLGYSATTEWRTMTLPLSTATRNVGIQIMTYGGCLAGPVRFAPAPSAGKVMLVGGITAD